MDSDGGLGNLIENQLKKIGHFIRDLVIISQVSGLPAVAGLLSWGRSHGTTFRLTAQFSINCTGETHLCVAFLTPAGWLVFATVSDCRPRVIGKLAAK